MNWFVGLIAALAPGCALAVQGDIDEVWMTTREDALEPLTHAYSDDGAVFCVTRITNGSTKKTLDVSITKIAEPESIENLDGGSPPPPGAQSVRVGDVVAHVRAAAPLGTAVPFSLRYGQLDARGEPDHTVPLALGRYQCAVQLSDDEHVDATFEVSCPAARITPASACASELAQCVAAGAGQRGRVCTCRSGAWDCP